jgi:hypothetical protein
MSIKRLTPFLMGITLGLVVAVSAFFFVDKAMAQSRNLGPFMIMHHGNTTATPGVFRVNQSTGYVSYCYVDSSGRPAVTCTAEVP